MYKKVDTSLNFLDREKEVLDFWKKNKIFEQNVKENDGSREFTFYDGPPTANGKPHIGHILTRVIKDIIPRYRVMKGEHCLRKAGWDTHGLPVELEVEKLLGIDGKKEIENYGIEPFIKKCKESVWKYKGEWEKMSDRVGYWADMEEPYITYDDNYIESVWWALKTIWEKGLLYKGYKIVPYCPRCGTALSSHEVAQGYKDVKETSVFVGFKAKNRENTYFLAWTTTPWTLPSNVALCMNPKESYVEIKAKDGTHYILAKKLVDKYFEEYEIIEEKLGSGYEYEEYIPLFDFVSEELNSKNKKAYYVTNADYVTMEDGTGVVHIAPVFGEDDHQVGLRYNLPDVKLVDAEGKLDSRCGKFSGLFVKTADKEIIKDLKERGLLFKTLEFTHSYPFCWRCDTPLIYYPRESWFIKMTAVKDKLLEANNSINWMPETIKTGRMGTFLENVIDWGISRERYWGTPLPVWVCNKCGKVHVIGSKEELKKLCHIDGDIELHRPYIDDCTFECDCGGTFVREKEVCDCWLDSGSMPFAQYHYPFENKELFEKHFPADFISEAIDQTRGWFYTLLAVSTLLFEKAPFKNCIVLGHVNDKNGIKMSKHKGNVVDPWSVLDKQGADAVRWYFYTGSAPWLPSRFYDEAVSEAQRKFMGTLWNTYAFFVLYADIDKYDPSKYTLDNCKLSLMDKWVLSKLNSLVKTVDKGLSEYNIFESARALQDFTDDLSNWYVRRGRERYWGHEMTEDKISAYTTLYTVLVTMAKISAPFTPFMAESIYQNLVPAFYKDAPISVHLCSFPKVNEKYIDLELEKGMKSVLDIVNLGRACRNTSNIKNRQPLQKIFVCADVKNDLSSGLLEIAKDELNVKEVEYLKSATAFISYKLKPQLKTLGPKYGAKLGKVKAFLESCDANAIVETVKKGESYKVNYEGDDFEFTMDDLLISSESAEGYTASSDNGLTVVLDTHITEELKELGIKREFISKIQSMRKDAGFEVTDRINIFFKTESEYIKGIIFDSKEIKSVVLADSLLFGDSEGFNKDLDINGENCNVTIKKVQ
ncbi:MAG: isoleucine--tRNA ligase [Firmicutes bacterium]|nr:isoleucine--tRNA ligase [Candidatus Caballimonas caccae]